MVNQKEDVNDKIDKNKNIIISYYANKQIGWNRKIIYTFMTSGKAFFTA